MYMGDLQFKGKPTTAKYDPNPLPKRAGEVIPFGFKSVADYEKRAGAHMKSAPPAPPPSLNRDYAARGTVPASVMAAVQRSQSSSDTPIMSRGYVQSSKMPVFQSDIPMRGTYMPEDEKPAIGIDQSGWVLDGIWERNVDNPYAVFTASQLDGIWERSADNPCNLLGDVWSDITQAITSIGQQAGPMVTQLMRPSIVGTNYQAPGIYAGLPAGVSPNDPYAYNSAAYYVPPQTNYLPYILIGGAGLLALLLLTR